MNRDVMIAKDLKNGSLMCTVCSTQVKAKVWTAHVNGRIHVENVKRLKQATSSSTQSAQSGTKRKQRDEEKLAGHIHKRLRDEENREAQSSTNSATPWRAEAQRQSAQASGMEGKFKNVKIIEGLPAGFFDDDRMNSRVKDTMEKEKVLDTEVERFFKEVSEVDNQMEDADEKAAEIISIQRDFDLIDDQMERWKSINELEIKKESLVKSVQKASESTAKVQNYSIRDCAGGPSGMECRPTTIAMDDSTDDDELEVDWRTKTL